MRRSQARYVVAVSGGVDSVVLLDALASQRLAEIAPDCRLPIADCQLIVAHFDHGMRADSAADEQLVRGAADEHGLIYETARDKLGGGASEAQARQARYKFLRSICKKYNAQLLTAHHQDDVLETMVLNLLRGTGWRGLVSLDSEQIIRPLLATPKAQLLAYAQKYRLAWREDRTNQDQNYLRNYVRLTLLPKLYWANAGSRQQLLDTHFTLRSLKKDIATELQNKYTPLPTSRYFFIMTPPLVARELLYYHLTRLDPAWHPSRRQLVRLLHFIKTGAARKTLPVSKSLHISLTSRRVTFQSTAEYGKLT